MVADIGGGTSDIAIIALGGIVNSVSLRHAGDEMDEAIVAYMRKNYNLLIGDETAEKIKKTLGCAIEDYEFENKEDSSMEAKGRDILSGLPRTIPVEAHDIYKALEEAEYVQGRSLESAPPELAADIVVNGMVLAGGGARIKGLDILIERATGLHVIVAENALEAVAEGTGKSLEQIQKIRRYTAKNNRI